MIKKLKFVFVALVLLFAGYYVTKYYAIYVLKNQTEGLSVFVAQSIFPPEDLFVPVFKTKLYEADIVDSKSIRFSFTPKYIGPYMIGISGNKNNIFYIPNYIYGSLECNSANNVYSNTVESVVMFSGTPHSGKGAVLGIIHVKDQTQVICYTTIDKIIFNDINVTNYQLVVSRMYVK
ncbi:MAG: hypothetical protein DBP02_04620 [gamma proteobacterium symbiont of Ctena orbiculata]|nr:MAG: hypothetical protein DBP02_04620 [gamma proteobacterium symbiont of Ctena orbiculata]